MTSERLEFDKNYRDLRRNLLAKDCSEIPKIETFSKMNFIPIQPAKQFGIENKENPGVKKKQKENQTVSNYIIDTEYERPVRQKLRFIYNAHKTRFEEICKQVIDAKFLKIYEEIYKFMLFMKFCDEPFLRTIILNTDQNANEFFTSMDSFINSRFLEHDDANKRFIYINDSNFKDMKGLFKLLTICADGWYLENTSEEKIERLIIIREIQKIDKLNLNILIGRIIEYHQNPDRIYTNILVFDVSYDPRGLFEKIKPNHLCKMSFNNVENIPSRNIYQEVLYKYIYSERANFFIPHSINLKKIVDYVNNHQISVKSFKHYFKFLIIHFFLIESWKNDEYLMYDLSLTTITKTSFLEDFFSTQLGSIYGSKSRMYKKDDVEFLLRRYVENQRNVKLFFDFYTIFESFAMDMKYGTNATDEDKYQFFFEFLQFGEDFTNMNENRVNVVRKYIAGKKNYDYYNWIKEKIYTDLLKVVEHMDEIPDGKNSEVSVDSLQTIKEVLENLYKQIYKGNRKSKRYDEMDLDLPGSLTSEQYLDKFLSWLNEEFFTLQCFSYINLSVNRKIYKNEKRMIINCTKNYIKFVEVVNPSISSIVIDILGNFGDHLKAGRTIRTNKRNKLSEIPDDTLHNITSDNFDENYTLSMIYKQFLLLYSHAPTEFRLKYLFAEFLRQYSIDSENNKEWFETMKTHFLYFCHVFYLLGLISRKTVKSDVFVKNYFELPSYFLK